MADQPPVFNDKDLGSMQNWMEEEGFDIDDLTLNDFEPSTKNSKRGNSNRAHYQQNNDDDFSSPHSDEYMMIQSNNPTNNPHTFIPNQPFNPQTIVNLGAPSQIPPIPPPHQPQIPTPSPSFFTNENSSPQQNNNFQQVGSQRLVSSSDPNNFKLEPSSSSPFPHQNPQDTLTPSSSNPFSPEGQNNNNNNSRSISPFSPFTNSNLQSNVKVHTNEVFDHSNMGYLPDQNNEFFDNFFNECSNFKNQINQIKQQQSQILSSSNSNQDHYSSLLNQQENLKRILDERTRNLEKMLKTAILPPPDLVKIWSLKQTISNLISELELYYSELNSFLTNQQKSCFVALTIVDQDYLPLTLQKGKPSDEGITVQILCGTQAKISNVSNVNANVVLDPLVAKQISGGTTSTKNLENDVQQFDSNWRATFHPKFTAGSRKTLATLKFTTQILVNGVSVTLTSHPSHPFLITTNDIQFEESEGILLRHFAFSNERDTEIPWYYLANILHAFFLRATRQDPQRPIRSLSTSEINYLHTKFFGEKYSVSCKTFETFYEWFGKNIQKIRYQRHLCSMFQSGYIYGFVNRDFVQRLLQDQPKGTFIIRFSERHPGTIAICYVIDDPDPQNRVRHYLITSEDVYSAKKTLPDFLIEWNIFTSVIQVTRETNGTINHISVDKLEALDRYRTKKNGSNEKKGGYDQELIGGKG